MQYEKIYYCLQPKTVPFLAFPIVLYTDDKKDSNGSVKVYASTYILSAKGNMTKLKPVKSDEEFDFLSKILDSSFLN